MTRWGMVIDAARCVGCQACTVACKTENQSPLDAWYAPVIEWEEGEFPDATLNYLLVLWQPLRGRAVRDRLPLGGAHTP